MRPSAPRPCAARDHVRPRTDDFADRSRSRSAAGRVEARHDDRDAPVEHEHLAEVAEHDIRRLEIAMDHAADVRELEGEACLGERAEQPLARIATDRVAVALRDPRQDICERRAGEPFHHEVRPTLIILRELVDRVIGGRALAHLAPEPIDLIQRRRRIEQPLDRDLSPHHQVARGEHLAHAATPDPLEHPVAPATERRHARRRSPLRDRRRDLLGRRHLGRVSVTHVHRSDKPRNRARGKRIQMREPCRRVRYR